MKRSNGMSRWGIVSLLWLCAGLFVVPPATRQPLCAPLRNVPVEIRQPDGKTIHCLASGDEFYNWLHDDAGYTIVQHPETGTYVYADEVGGKLVVTDHIVATVDPALLGIKKNAAPSPEVMKKRAFHTRKSLMAGSPLRPDLVVKAPQTGKINNVVIFIRFSDDPDFTDKISFYDAMFNESHAGKNSMYNYYKEVSYGQLSIKTTFYPETKETVLCYKDSRPRSYYQPYSVTNTNGYEGGGSGSERRSREHALLKRAVEGVKGDIPATLDLDGDGDGKVDNVAFIVKGQVTAKGALLWPHMWSLYSDNVAINGKRVYTYNFQLEASLKSSGVGVLCHEMFHSLGAPDLYHYTYDGLRPVHTWDVMQSDLNPPQHMGAYMKHRYGKWIDSIPKIAEAGTYTLSPLTSRTRNVYRIDSPNSTTEYFLLEYRKKTGVFEGSLPGQGLLIYRINTTQDGKGNRDGPPDEVYIYRPGGTINENGTPDNAPYSLNVGRTEMNSSTDPQSFLSDGSEGGLYIKNVGSVGDSLSFSVDFATSAPKVLSFKIDNGAAATSEQEVKLNNTVKGAPTEYMAGELPNFAGASWKPYSSSPEFTLSAGTGVKTIYFKVRNNKGESQVVHDAIKFDSSAPMPNLVLYKPSGWSDKIVISNVMGTTTDSTSLSASDILYLNYAVLNSGKVDITNRFYTKVYIDGVLKAVYYSLSLRANHYTYVKDRSIGSLSAGEHTIRVVADATDTVAESNESGNEYTKTIVVKAAGDAPNLTPYKPSGWSDRIVVSKTRGASQDDASFDSDTPLYVDFAVVNLGKTTIDDRFWIDLTVDDEQVDSFYVDVLQANRTIRVLDKSIGKLKAGKHTIKVLSDSTDAIPENNEDDNAYSKTITVR